MHFKVRWEFVTKPTLTTIIDIRKENFRRNERLALFEVSSLIINKQTLM